MFKKAAPVWAKDLIGKKNTMLSFETEVMFEGKQAVIRIAADALYRLHINGAFVSHGPARCGANYWRVDEIDITSYMKKGSNTIAVSVVSYGVYSYEYVMQPGFLQAEVAVDGAVTAATGVEGDFTARQNLSKEVAAERSRARSCVLENARSPIVCKAVAAERSRVCSCVLWNA